MDQWFRNIHVLIFLRVNPFIVFRDLYEVNAQDNFGSESWLYCFRTCRDQRTRSSDNGCCAIKALTLIFQLTLDYNSVLLVKTCTNLRRYTRTNSKGKQQRSNRPHL